MFDWVRSHDVLLGWLGAVSLLMFVGGLITVPWLVVHMPADYFVRRRHLVDRWQPQHPVLRFAALIIKNFCGIVLVLAGLAMLLLPGQGILTVLVGLMLLDFPGKFALEQWIARRKTVLGAMNWIRAKAHRPPIQSPRHSTDAAGRKRG